MTRTIFDCITPELADAMKRDSIFAKIPPEHILKALPKFPLPPYLRDMERIGATMMRTTSRFVPLPPLRSSGR